MISGTRFISRIRRPTLDLSSQSLLARACTFSASPRSNIQYYMCPSRIASPIESSDFGVSSVLWSSAVGVSMYFFLPVCRNSIGTQILMLPFSSTVMCTSSMGIALVFCFLHHKVVDECAQPCRFDFQLHALGIDQYVFQLDKGSFPFM